jgi:hypothetical protein
MGHFTHFCGEVRGVLSSFIILGHFKCVKRFGEKDHAVSGISGKEGKSAADAGGREKEEARALSLAGTCERACKIIRKNTA